jgi:transforming growth factor-beta-induced protein
MYQNFLMHSKNFSLKILTVFVFFVFISSGCNESDKYVAPAMEDLPSLTEYLEAFDEEVEYTEVLAEGNSDARWGYKRWKRKPTFFTLVAALNYTGLLKTVIKEKLTIFAPDDKAFGELGLNFFNIRHKIDKETLTAILLNHVADGFVFARDLDCSLQTLGNTTLRVVEADGKIVFQDDSEELTNILFTDRRALRSVFHGIDKVLTLNNPAGTIADIADGLANSDPAEFTQLVDALKYTGLLDVVSDPESVLTVFAPTDKAFNKLYSTLNIASVRDLPEDVVSRVLLHHVVGGRVFSNCLVNGEVPTENTNITVNVDDLTITGSLVDPDIDNTVNLVTDPFLLDIQASNGVIHVIDGVLVPENYLEPLP